MSTAAIMLPSTGSFVILKFARSWCIFITMCERWTCFAAVSSGGVAAMNVYEPLPTTRGVAGEGIACVCFNAKVAGSGEGIACV
jgi:hypothetical protein